MTLTCSDHAKFTNELNFALRSNFTYRQCCWGKASASVARVVVQTLVNTFEIRSIRSLKECSEWIT